MGRGSDSTLRIDEPLHFMFLVAYLITYFCCAYLLFICFKHCRRMWKRKPCRPSRIRNVAELVNNFHARVPQPPPIAQVHAQVLNIQENPLCHELVCGGILREGEEDWSISEGETNTSRISPFLSPLPRFRPEASYAEELPSYASISEDEESPPPSYNECVLSLPDNTNLLRGHHGPLP